MPETTFIEQHLKIAGLFDNVPPMVIKYPRLITKERRKAAKIMVNLDPMSRFMLQRRLCWQIQRYVMTGKVTRIRYTKKLPHLVKQIKHKKRMLARKKCKKFW